jgi:thiamine-monophosphate kinase
MPKRVERVRSGPLGEFEIIARYFAPLATNPAALALRDDAAFMSVPEGQELVLTCDTIIDGVHFLAADPPSSIGHKALAVNLSDLAAKGARPHAYLLSLALPELPAASWLEGFAEGLRGLQEQSGIGLIGGDTSAIPGPLTITITALGLVPQGEAVLRRGALPGDLLCVSGTIGDAALGLKLLREPRLAADWGLSKGEGDFLVDRYRRPSARTALALPLRQYAHAAIDVSDGLAGDTAKLCKASGVSALIEAVRVPLSLGAAKAIAHTPALLAELLAAGDDYEVLAAIGAPHAEAFAAEAESHEQAVTAIGSITPGDGAVEVKDEAGRALELGHKGFAHF